MSRLSVKMKMSGEPFLIDTDSEVIIIKPSREEFLKSDLGLLTFPQSPPVARGC